jgi:hypothetical protein
MGIHIYSPMVSKKFVLAGKCSDCKKRTRFLGFAYEFGGFDVTCLRCGRHWQDGEWIPLSFARSARKDNIDEAKRRWRKFASLVGPITAFASG